MSTARTAARGALASLALLCLGAAAAPAQQPMLWQTTVPGHEAAVLSSVPLVAGGLLFTAGWEPHDLQTGAQRGVVAAFSAKTGALKWTAVGDPSTGEFPSAGFHSLAISHGVLLAGGTRTVASFEHESGVRAWNRESGALLWRREFPGTIGGSVAVAGKVAFVLTNRYGPFEPVPSVQLRACDLLTGEQLWIHEDPAIDSHGSGLAVAGKFVAVTGNLGHFMGGDVAPPIDVFVRVHDAKTGALLWEDIFDGSEGSDYANAVAIKGSRLFVGGRTGPSAVQAPNDAFISAYALASGEKLWSPSLAQEGNENLGVLAVGGKSVISLAGKTPGILQVRSHHVKTGAILWDELQIESGSSGAGLAANARRVIVVRDDAGVLALGSKDGSLAWTSPWTGTSAAIAGKRVFVAGTGGVAAFPLK
jgi:outer membrane protein assembly factor BamB